MVIFLHNLCFFVSASTCTKVYALDPDKCVTKRLWCTTRGIAVLCTPITYSANVTDLFEPEQPSLAHGL